MFTGREDMPVNTLLLTFLTQGTRWSRFTSNFYMLWLVKIWQVSSCVKFIQHAPWNLFTLTIEADRVSTCDVFNCLFPLSVQNIRGLSKSEIRFRNGIVFVFQLAWCVRGLKSLKRFWPYLIVFNVSRMVSLSNYCIWWSFFISNLMKSSVVYAAI